MRSRMSEANDGRAQRLTKFGTPALQEEKFTSSELDRMLQRCLIET